MSLGAFFGVVSTVDFALLGLWWVTVQARADLRRHHATASRMAYVVSQQFIVPGTASLLAQVDPAVTAVWRVSFAVAGVTGIAAIVLLVPALAASGEVTVARSLRFGAVPLYALMTLIAVLFFPSGTLGALQGEGILFCLVVFLSTQVAWAAAMSMDPAAETGTGGGRRDPPPLPEGWHSGPGGHIYPDPPAARRLPPHPPAGPPPGPQSGGQYPGQQQ
jgi:hypothetical protein